MTLKKDHNFTLIELMVVVAIIGILASLLLPVLGKARHRARIAVCLSNQRQLGTAIYLYVDDNDDYAPAEYSGGITWDDLIGTGYDGRNLSLDQMTSDDPGAPAKLYQCPTDDSHDDKDRTRSYSMNQGKMDGSKESKRGLVADGTGDSLQLAKINFPTESIMLTEKHDNDNRLGRHGAAVIRAWSIQTGHSNGTLEWNHSKYKMNFLFVDGSAREMPFVATYAGSGKDPWTDQNEVDTMWDCLR